MKIYLDVDDTLNDFRSHVISLGVPEWKREYYLQPFDTWTPEEVEIDKTICKLMDSKDFWMSIPVRPGAKKLIDKCQSIATTYLLTSYPSLCKGEKDITAQKYAYCKQKLGFPRSRTIVCARADKKKYAVSADCVLIDDAAKNCQEWSEAGGFAIQFTSIDKVIVELNDLTAPSISYVGYYN